MIVHYLPDPTGLLQFFVFNDDEDLMGTVGCQLTTGNQQHWGVIQNLFVYEQFRRQGAATYLLTTVTKCLADPVDRLHLEIPPLEILLAILPAHAWSAPQVFEKCGFEKIGKTGTSTAYQFTFRRQHAIIPIH